MRTIEEVVVELRKDIHSDVYLGKKTIGTYLDEILEIHNAETPRWIPVSERLPKSSGVYIVSRWFSDGEESAILTDANYYDGNGDWYNDNRINWGRDLVTDKIVAWMPLPKPYEPQESEEA